MAVDLTFTFHLLLYILALECLLFFAVVMHSQSCDPGWHSGVARSFGLFFLFQCFGSLLLALSEDFYPSPVSSYFAAFSVVWIVFAVIMCIPAAVVVAFPETDETRPHRYKAPAVVIGILILVLCIFLLPGQYKAAPDIPYVPSVLRRRLLGAMAGATLILALAAAVRMIRGMKGSNGALAIGVALLIVFVFGIVWALMEPLCRQKGPNDPFPASCPMPASFDHNAMLTCLIIVANALTAEGVLRLMQAGDGSIPGYTRIQV